MKFLTHRIFGKKIINQKKNSDTLFEVKYLESINDMEAKNVLDDLKGNMCVGYYIPNVISNIDRLKLIEYFNAIRANNLTQSEFLDVYPEAFYTYGYQGELTAKYFETPKQVNQEIVKSTGLDLNKLIYKLLTALNAGNKVSAKPANENGGKFHSFQFRSLNKRQSNIFLHCENMLINQMAEVNNPLGSFKVKPNAIPYFICLQEAEGGEIVLFDYPWRDGQYSDTSDASNEKIVDPKEGPVECRKKSVPKNVVSVKAGDMIVFNGGTTWHMVNKVLGNRERITLGGFLEPQENGEIYVWA